MNGEGVASERDPYYDPATVKAEFLANGEDPRMFALKGRPYMSMQMMDGTTGLRCGGGNEGEGEGEREAVTVKPAVLSRDDSHHPTPPHSPHFLSQILCDECGAGVSKLPSGWHYRQNDSAD